MANIFRIGTGSTHWQYIITAVIPFIYDVWSGNYWDKATSDLYCIHFCTKNRDSNSRMKEWGEKKNTYINTLYCSVQSNVVSSFTDSLMSYNSESAFIC